MFRSFVLSSNSITKVVMQKIKNNSFKYPIADRQWVNALFQDANLRLDRPRENSTEVQRAKDSAWEDIGYTRKVTR